MQGFRTMTFVCLCALAVASCGGGSSPTSPSTPPPGGGTGTTTITVTITGQGGRLAFFPNPATVQPGQLVAFKNNDVVPHRVVLDDLSVQTPEIPAGGTSAPVAMGLNGSKTYHCSIHPGMVGGFNGAEAEPPPGCSQAYCGG